MRASPRSNPRHGFVSGRSRLVFGLLLVFILGGAAVLRFYRLDAQSFWNDEGNSARIAERSLDLIVEGAAGDVHPPGYYLLLHAWRASFGQSEFALRSLSVAAGLALVILTGLLGRYVFGPVAGIAAAFLGALSPLAIYYSQEARMYSLLGALSAGSMLVAFCILDRVGHAPAGHDTSRELLPLAAYVLANAAGLYTHYAFIFVLVAHNAVFCLRWLSAWHWSAPDWRGLGMWAAAQLGAGVLFLPWVPAAMNAAGWSSAGGGYELGAALLDVLRVLVVGITQSIGGATLALGAASVLLIAGLWPGAEGRGGGHHVRRWIGVRALVIYLLVPLALFFGFDLYKPAWLKFLVVLLAPFHVLTAHGIANVGALVSRALGLEHTHDRCVRVAVSAALMVVVALLAYPSLHNLYFDEAYARDNYRQLAADIREMRRPGDAIVLNAPNQWEVFTYYYPDRDVYPAPYHPGPERAASFLSPLIERYDRLFVLYWGDAESDPRRRVASWLAQHAYKASDQWYGDVRLATYGVAPLPAEPAVSSEAVFGERILLQGYTVVGDVFAPADVVPVTLFWEALDQIDEPYKVSVQMLDESGRGRLVSQIDTVPGDGLAPTTSWEAGMAQADRYGVLVPAGGSPGRYRLIAAVYHQVSGERLPVVVDGEGLGDHLSLGHIAVGASQE